MKNEIALDDIPIVGDLRMGRPTLGNMVNVSVYRLMLYSLKAALTAKVGKEEATQIVYLGGKLAGKTIYLNLFKKVTDEVEFFERIGELFLRFKIGRFEVQKIDKKNKRFIFNLREDLDCSGLPPDGETKCNFDEGLFSGMLSEYYDSDFITIEKSCWGTGDKSCFFESFPIKQ